MPLWRGPSRLQLEFSALIICAGAFGARIVSLTMLVAAIVKLRRRKAVASFDCFTEQLTTYMNSHVDIYLRPDKSTPDLDSQPR
jgi:hypothetical protein